ncbi:MULTISPECIES: hypothetical protein [Streptomyces]|uniref:hypothetical protein n=1 Tax=Streptomyces TaxID=1883 RepID=UPI000765B458|nr:MULTISPECIES: hypothetical protein [Streptomyces]MBE4783955.1 hypothetical protein [Streptomyces caniscabiei]MBE4791546.1 hypothetical protein [Streptomyces caniscabiei]MDX3009217.1 hypothetical protein [Streptomyces caniscabiei]MDX3831347.1 hypothetical protein [Streptomyces europaeiscabiei]
MTPVTAVAIGLCALWLIALTGYIASFRRSSRTAAVHGPRLRPSYAEGLERMRAAVAGAHRETQPGAPSSDLTQCQEIWPDASKHTPKEWS